jgi:cytochrome c
MRYALLALVAALSLVLVSCPGPSPAEPTLIGDPDRGRQLFDAYGCVACHAVQGVGTARGRVGPPLDGIANQRIIAGVLPNTQENLARWIIDPAAFAPNTAMPDVGVTEEHARDIAAWLHTLR